MPMPRHGIAGAVIGTRFHLVSGMMQSAGALVFLDPTLSTHTALHDILELQFGARAATGGSQEHGRDAVGGSGHGERTHDPVPTGNGRSRERSASALAGCKKTLTRATTSTARRVR